MVTAIHWSLHWIFNAFEFNKVILAKWRRATARLWLTPPRFICSSSIWPFLASRSAACWGDLTCNMLEVTKMRSGEEESSVLLGCLPWHSVVWGCRHFFTLAARSPHLRLSILHLSKTPDEFGWLRDCRVWLNPNMLNAHACRWGTCLSQQSPPEGNLPVCCASFLADFSG